MKPSSDKELINKLQREIEDIKEKLNTLSEENFQLKNLIDNLPGDIYWKDISGKWSGLNKHCVKSLIKMGFINSKEQILGKTDYDIFDKQTADGYRVNDQKSIEERCEISLEESTNLPNGDEVTLLSTKSPFYNSDNEVIGIVGNTINITHLKKIERQLKSAQKKSEAANNAKAEFIANMSHDIRTPLTGIIGISNIVENESHEDTIKEYAHMLNLSGEHLLSLLNSVLEIVASDTIGQKILNLSVFNLKDLLNRIFELEQPSLQLKSIEFKLEIDKNLPAFVESDKEKIYRIILNILSNAIKFTHNGTITIKASLVEEKNDELRVKFQVMDTGIGISKQDIDKIFDQFYRATPAHIGQFDGYGVGLHIVQKFLKLLNGEIFVESEPGNGTCISLTLPLKKALRPDNYEKPDSLLNFKNNCEEPVKDTTKAQVLLVEDNLVACRVAANMLKKAGCFVTEVQNGTEALALFIDNQFDLILTDIGLPDFSGLELCKKIRYYEKQNNKEHNSIPIIAISGHDKNNLPTYQAQYGLTSMYKKPLKQNDLIQLITKYYND